MCKEDKNSPNKGIAFLKDNTPEEFEDLLSYFDRTFQKHCNAIFDDYHLFRQIYRMCTIIP